MFRSKLINQCFIAITLFHQLHGAESVIEAESSPEQKLTPEAQVVANKKLLDAAASGDTTNVVHAIADGAKVDTINNLGFTPLHLTASNGHTDTVQALLNQGANPNVITTRGSTPLFLAIQNGHIDTANTLLAHGADPDRLFNKDFKPILSLNKQPNNKQSNNKQFNKPPITNLKPLSDNELLKIPLFAGLEKKYWNQAGLTFKQLIVRQMYIDYQTDKNELLLEVFEGLQYPSLLDIALPMVTPQFMLQDDIPFEIQQQYVRSHKLSLDPEATRAFVELANKVREKESQEIMSSKQDSLEKQKQLNELNETWKERFKELSIDQLKLMEQAHTDSLKTLHQEYVQDMQTLLIGPIPKLAN